MPRPAPNPQTVQKALALLSEGVSLREAARRVRVSASTVYAWKQDANNPARSETKPNETEKANATKQPPRRAPPNTAEPNTTFDASALLAAKDAQIEFLTVELTRWQTQADKLTEALSDEREARRRSDVLQLQAFEHRARPSDNVATTNSHRRELWVFIVAVAALVLLALALLVVR